MKRLKQAPAALTAAILLASCNGGPSDPGLPPLEVAVAAGDGQFGTAGQTLPVRLHVVVRTASSGSPRKQIGVLWAVESGDASFTTSAATLTDDGGSAYMTVRLGTTPGDIVVSATVTEQESASASFRLHLVDRPVLQELSASAINAGETLVLTGLNLSPTPAQNVVLFSGIRGRVTSASGTQLSVEVPRCLPSRRVEVTVQLGLVASDGIALDVMSGGEDVSLAPGESLEVTDDLTCVRLRGGGPYLAVVQSGSTVAGGRHGYELVGLATNAPPSVPPAPALGAPTAPAVDDPRALHDRFEAALRRREARLLATPPVIPEPSPSAVAQPPGVPSQGETRTFRVFNVDGGFDEVDAVAAYVGDEAALFVEVAGASNFSQSDLEAFATRFDEVIHPTVTDAFGNASDLDGNERVVILFTSTVNRWTPKGTSGGFVGGFFYGVDLLPERENSNGGEIFYTLVPDPNGAFSDPRSKEDLLRIVPAILAHEFQHMVHFNERVLKLEAPSTEALWLSEALAQMAEEMVARAYAGDGDAASAELFRDGNFGRARRYLDDPAAVSLIYGSGQGTLAERGGGWLHALYLTSRAGEGVLLQLVRSTSTGVSNVSARLATPFEELLSDWWAATYLDGSGFAGPLDYAGLDLRDLLGEEYTLMPTTVGGADFARSGSLWSSSARYYIVVPPAQGSVTLRLGGEAGGASPAEAALRMRLVRLP